MLLCPRLMMSAGLILPLSNKFEALLAHAQELKKSAAVLRLWRVRPCAATRDGQTVDGEGQSPACVSSILLLAGACRWPLGAGQWRERRESGVFLPLGLESIASFRNRRTNGGPSFWPPRYTMEQHNKERAPSLHHSPPRLPQSMPQDPPYPMDCSSPAQKDAPPDCYEHTLAACPPVL